MTKRKNNSSVTVAILKNEEGKMINKLYLSNRDEEKGIDIKLDLQGYKLIAL